ncbi:hypothetical protein [Bacteroides propionicifaciens]|uniref:hypothetical protein n=1 Tax=Bacteroides propionicifaciens TaxID=392838 RepID=UPI00036FAC4C|nr:hypothetical protein [Bacteroides propionicifaciens]
MIPKERKPLSNFQIVCIILLWAVLCVVIVNGAANLDGPTILSLVMATVLIFIPVYKSISKRRKK